MAAPFTGPTEAEILEAQRQAEILAQSAVEEVEIVGETTAAQEDSVFGGEDVAGLPLWQWIAIGIGGVIGLILFCWIFCLVGKCVWYRMKRCCNRCCRCFDKIDKEDRKRLRPHTVLVEMEQ